MYIQAKWVEKLDKIWSVSSRKQSVNVIVLPACNFPFWPPEESETKKKEALLSKRKEMKHETKANAMATRTKENPKGLT